MKRVLDIVISSLLLVVTLPITIPVTFLIYWQDGESPFYSPFRVGRFGRLFRMVKFRSMVKNADSTGVDSTGANDSRITGIGRFVRRYKIDELPQLWNVIKGEMSLVGPRPNVEREVTLYTEEERHLLDVAPGITDLSSIVFADENDVLKDSPDPDIDYNQRIRPWKSRLGLLYVRNHDVRLDLKIIILTATALFSRERALSELQRVLLDLPANDQLRRVAMRQAPLVAFPPPGANEIVTSRT